MLKKNVYLIYPAGYSGSYLKWAVEISDADKRQATPLDPLNNQNTKTFEFDTSQTYNEPGNYALRSAIEQGIIELVKRGERLGLWKFKEASNELVQEKAEVKGAAKNGDPQK